MADSKAAPAKAPLVKKDFANSAAPAKPPAPVSKIELKKLESQRAKPAPAPTPPAPMKAQAKVVNQQQAIDREKRIKEIQGRLAAQQGKAREGFNKSR